MTPPLLLALLAAAGAPDPAAAEAPPAATPSAVRVRLDRSEARLGEPFELTIEIRHGAGERYALPPSLALEPFRLLGGGCPAQAEGTETVTRCSLRLALFELGRHDLPELALPVATPAGARTLRIPGPSVTGIGVLDPAAPTEALALKDLAPPAPLRVLDVPLLVGALALLLAAGGAWSGWRAWHRRARRAAEPPAPLPPHARFALQLDALALWWGDHPDRGRDLFFRLSEHVREYLGAVSGLNALDLTTAELLARLSFQPDPRVDLAMLRRFLDAADLVKFARAPAGDPEARDGLAFARALLERTRPPPTGEATP